MIMAVIASTKSSYWLELQDRIIVRLEALACVQYMAFSFAALTRNILINSLS